MPHTKEITAAIHGVKATIEIEKVFNIFSNIGINIEPCGEKNSIGNHLYAAQNELFNIAEDYIGERNDTIFDEIVNFVETATCAETNDSDIEQFLSQLKNKYQQTEEK